MSSGANATGKHGKIAVRVLRGDIKDLPSQFTSSALVLRLNGEIAISVTPDSHGRFQIPLTSLRGIRLIRWEHQDFAGGMIIGDHATLDANKHGIQIVLRWVDPLVLQVVNVVQRPYVYPVIDEKRSCFPRMRSPEPNTMSDTVKMKQR